MSKTICFVGAKLEYWKDELKIKLKPLLQLLIENDYHSFWFMDKEFFNDICLDVLKSLNETYDCIKIYVLKEKKDINSEEIYKQIINNSDLVISYKINVGSDITQKAYKFAVENNKKIIEI